MEQWQVSVTFRTPDAIGEDDMLDLLEEFGRYGAAAAFDRDSHGGSLTLSVDGETPMAALDRTLHLLGRSRTVRHPTVTGFEALAGEEAARRSAEPLWPPVVSYAEIAKMAGVSRQRAAKFREASGFPSPVLETGLGPLFLKSAVRAWVERRNTKPGRPRRAGTE